MYYLRIFATLALSGLAGCSLMAKAGLGTDTTPSTPTTDSVTSGGPSSPVEAPKVESDEEDSGPIQQIIGWLDELEASLKAKDWSNYLQQSGKLNVDLVMRNGHADEKKIGAIKTRLAALDAAAFKTFGGRLYKVVGNGARVTELDEAGKEAAAAVIKACQANLINTYGRESEIKELAAAPAKYEEALSRAKKINPDSLLWLASSGGRFVDMPLDLMRCELAMVAADQQRLETYQVEVLLEEDRLKTEKICGMLEWLADGVKVGSNKFAPYSRTAGGQQYVVEVPCKKFPKKDKYPSALRSAVNEFTKRESLKKVVTVAVGKPYFETNDEDLKVYRYQQLASYSKEFSKSANPCGGNEKLFCEVGGSKTAEAYNRAEHALDRAEANAGKDPELCRQHLKIAKSQADELLEYKSTREKRKLWIAGATYKTKKGAKLAEKVLVANITKMGKLADDRQLNKFCATPFAGAE